MTHTISNEKMRIEAINQFRKAQEGAVLEVADQGLLTLTNLVASGAVDVSPNFQRRERWSPEKQSLLIESFLTNIPVPPVYLAEDSVVLGSYAVIDGKQRLTSISSFFQNELVLRGLTRLGGLNGLRYDALPREIRNPLGMKALRTITLLRASDPELKHEVFLRLNTGGEVLNAQEIRNVAYRGPLNDLIYSLAEHPFLRHQLKVNPPSSPNFRQMLDAEYVLRFLTLADGWREFKGDLRGAFDDFMVAKRFADDIELEQMRESFNECIGAAEAIWELDAFKRPGRDQALAGLFDAQMVALHEIGRSKHEALIRSRDRVRTESANLFADKYFDEAARIGTNTPARLKKRIDMMLRVLSNIAGASGGE
ncbi:uncharacterized protein DUF262 [Krasilnikovia cinnamomea]|uniref:Uncharacterized protein DUF262 n=1 Tax=Krasilnikovia cinnamomea TaxID=349313 RepID=A0A4Q7ZH07_9ACTN|nr:DUF262 domain-containing protein [Krasilnikovia cinnamomea]RZU49349.1 uncharacterized protein DUF262 [Krasilnikovia cinnamomea]